MVVMVVIFYGTLSCEIKKKDIFYYSSTCARNDLNFNMGPIWDSYCNAADKITI